MTTATATAIATSTPRELNGGQRRRRREQQPQQPVEWSSYDTVASSNHNNNKNCNNNNNARTGKGDDSDNDDETDGSSSYDATATQYSDAGSTCLGDSFVVAIDWASTTGAAHIGPRYYHDTTNDWHKNADDTNATPIHHQQQQHNGLNDSLEDPYLPSLESTRRRLNHTTNHDYYSNHSNWNADDDDDESPEARLLLNPPVREKQQQQSTPSAICSVRHLLRGSSSPQKPNRSVQLCVVPNETPTPTNNFQYYYEAAPSVSSTTNNSAAKSLGSFDMPPCVVATTKRLTGTAIPTAAPSPVANPSSPSSSGTAGLYSSLKGSFFDFPTVVTDEEEDDAGFLSANGNDDPNDDTRRPCSSLKVQLHARFEKPDSFSKGEDDGDDDDKTDDDEDEEEEQNTSIDSSFWIPAVPTLTKAVTPSLKRHHAARLRVAALKSELEQLRQYSVVAARNTSSRGRMPMAKLYLELGLAEQDMHQYPAAINFFFQAAAIFRHFSRPVALATALDAVANAYCHAHEEGMTNLIHGQHKVSRIYRCLYEALSLRKQELGPWHVDTVDTLQHLAKLCLLTGHAARAAGHYLEVVILRKAIFGPNHVGTAVSAHCLGNAYLQAHNIAEAERWYNYTLTVYNAMQLPNNNPAVAKLLRDRKRLERVDRWITEDDPAKDENLLFEL